MLDIITIFAFVFLGNIILKSNANNQIKSKEKKVLPEIHYISGDEGIISHLRQFDMLWNIGLAVNRSIKISPFYSFHYPDVKAINLCQHFELETIQCINENSTKVFKDHDCVYTGLSHPATHYGWSENLPVSQIFNYSTVECVAGQVNLEIGVYPPFKRQHIPSGKIFKARYWELYELTKQILGITNETLLIVAHWRRGDQLTTRCPIIDGEPNTKLKPEKIDHSVNCGTVKEFINQVNLNIKNFIGTSKNSSNSRHIHSPSSDVSSTNKVELFGGLRIETTIKTTTTTQRTSMVNDLSNSKRLLYIATDEKNDKQLQEIKGMPAKIFSDIQIGLAKKNIVLNSLEVFILEVLIMCQATYLFTWGESSLHRFLHNCRVHNPVLRSNLIIDNHRGIVASNVKPK